MLHPPRSLSIALLLAMVAGVALGLTTDVGPFGLGLGLLVALYLVAAGSAKLTARRRSDTRRPA
jgi:hypothetical protein